MYGAAPAFRRVRLVTPPSNINGYDERWRVNVDTKLDHMLGVLEKLTIGYEKLDLRLTNLEKAPSVEAERQQQAQSKVNLWLVGGGCLYMAMSVAVATAGVVISLLLR
jgi:hypothetical protein